MARDSSPFAQRLKALAVRAGLPVDDDGSASGVQPPPVQPSYVEQQQAEAAAQQAAEAETPADEQPTGEFPAIQLPDADATSAQPTVPESTQPAWMDPPTSDDAPQQPADRVPGAWPAPVPQADGPILPPPDLSNRAALQQPEPDAASEHLTSPETDPRAADESPAPTSQPEFTEPIEQPTQTFEPAAFEEPQVPPPAWTPPPLVPPEIEPPAPQAPVDLYAPLTPTEPDPFAHTTPDASSFEAVVSETPLFDESAIEPAAANPVPEPAEPAAEPDANVAADNAAHAPTDATAAALHEALALPDDTPPSVASDPADDHGPSVVDAAGAPVPVEGLDPLDSANTTELAAAFADVDAPGDQPTEIHDAVEPPPAKRGRFGFRKRGAAAADAEIASDASAGAETSVEGESEPTSPEAAAEPEAAATPEPAPLAGESAPVTTVTAATDADPAAPSDPGSITSRFAAIGRRVRSRSEQKAAAEALAIQAAEAEAPAAAVEPEPQPTAYVDEEYAPAKPSFAERASLRRRAKTLRARRDAGLVELGAIVLDQSRFGDPTAGQLVRRRTTELADLDGEIAAIEYALEEERSSQAVAQLGVVHCATCDSLLGSADRFCAHCGAARPAPAAEDGADSAAS
jgi:hypothetical protein